MSVATDLALLHLPTDSSPTTLELKRAFAALAMSLHPDLGGDRARFEAVRDAYQRLRAEAERREAVCPACKGRGHLDVHAGFQVLRIQCEKCIDTRLQNP